jgi:hypothetical protein
LNRAILEIKGLLERVLGKKTSQGLLSKSQIKLLDEIEKGGGSSKSFYVRRKRLFELMLKLAQKQSFEEVTHTNFMKDHFKMLNDLFWGRLFLALAMYSSALVLLKRAIKRAEEIEQWDSVLAGARILEGYYAVRGDTKSFELYSSLSLKALDLASREVQLNQILLKWTIIFSKKRTATSDEIILLEKDVRRGKRILATSTHLNMVHLVGRLELFLLDAKMEYDKLFLEADRIAEFLKKNSGYSDYHKLGLYNGIKMYACVNLKKHSEAKKLLMDLERLNRPGTMNWFIFMEYYCILQIQSNKFSHAYDVYGKVVYHKGFEMLRGIQKDVWLLLSSYMLFLAQTKIWKDAPPEFSKAEFKSNKFVNDVFSLSADKTGLNVSVIILQVLFLLHLEKFEEIIDKKEALKRYVARYLSSKENERSRLFMTMLLRMIENDFSFAKTLEKTGRLQTQLSNLQMNYRASLGGNEIVDYEILWDWVLNTLKTKWPKAA